MSKFIKLSKLSENIKASKKQEDYTQVYNAVQSAIDNKLVTDPESDVEDLAYELLEQANLDVDVLTPSEWEYWKSLLIEAWKNAKW